MLERRGVLLTQAPRRRMEETSQEHAGGVGVGGGGLRGSEGQRAETMQEVNLRSRRSSASKKTRSTWREHQSTVS